MADKLKFSDQAKQALKLMQETKQSLFLTGKAGTGKSTLLEHFRNKTKKRTAILAPTGVAAINVKGETIHAFFGLKPGFEVDEAPLAAKKCKNPRLYTKLEAIVIDEISMVRADLLDAIDIFLRLVREDDRPFGGIQMIFIGDLYQLPPVVTRDDKEAFFQNYTSPFFFGSNVIQDPNFDMEYIELQEIYRQSDQEFIDILNAIRNKTVNTKHLQTLNQRVDKEFRPEGSSQGSLLGKGQPKKDKYIYLVTTNADANQINKAELEKLKNNEAVFYAETTGEVENNHFVTDRELSLKEGAQIMFVNNDVNRDWVNGTVGTITEIDEFNEELKVDINGVEVTVTPHTWEISKYVFKEGKFQREMIGSIKQFPLKLAWAITIHKSQGKTFDKVIIDLGRGTFAHGQAYVALSRCRSLKGTVLKRAVRPQDIRLDYTVQDFITNFQYGKASQNQSLEDKINIIEEAIYNRQKLVIDYLTTTNERSQRNVIPQVLDDMSFKGNTYKGLLAHCLYRKADRIFNVERILKVESQ